MLKLDEATLTAQGQISIPKQVREKLQLSKGDKVVFFEDDDGDVIIKQAEVSLDLSRKDWQDFLALTEKEPVTRVTGKSAALKHLDKLAKKK